MPVTSSHSLKEGARLAPDWSAGPSQGGLVPPAFVGAEGGAVTQKLPFGER